MEYTAEDLIAHKLQRAGILVAKPRFDREGADLLAMLGVGDGAKFCRIQCKGRSLLRSSTSNIDVKSDYVTDGLVLFLFVETGVADQTYLYCFFGSEIREKWISCDDCFRLTFSRAQLSSDLAPYTFSDEKVARIKHVIEQVDVRKELKVITGQLNVTLGPLTLTATGRVG